MDATKPVVCFFNATKAWGGGEKWHYEMSSQLHLRGYQVVLFTGKDTTLCRKALAAGLTVEELEVGSLSFLNPCKVHTLASMFRQHGADIIIINDSRDLKLAGLAARRAGVRRIIYRRGSAIPVRDSISNRWIFKNLVDDIIANSQETARTILKNNPGLCTEEKIHVIYNGMDLPAFDKLPQVAPYHRQGDEVIIGHAGRLTRQKGQHHLLDMAAMLKQKGLDFRMLIAGKGPLEKELKEAAREKGLSGEVIFLGFTENVKGMMLASDIFVLPSLWEGFGYVLAEAMACSRPVVAFDISSNPELIAHGETGFLTEPFDVEAMTEKIVILARDPLLREKMGAAGRQRVEQYFTLHHAVNQIDTLLQTPTSP